MLVVPEENEEALSLTGMVPLFFLMENKVPYRGPDDPKLPSNVKGLPEDIREQWVAIFNRALSQCEREGGSNCEGKAFQLANGVIKKRRAGEGEEQMPEDMRKKKKRRVPYADDDDVGEEEEDEEEEEEEEEEEQALPPVERPFRSYLQRLRDILVSKVKTDGELTAEDFSNAMKKARAHAGGTQRAANRAAQKAHDPLYDIGFAVKMEKADSRVQYRPAESTNERCALCKYYMGESCSLVEGTIMPEMYCNLFSLKGTTSSQPMEAGEYDLITMCDKKVGTSRLFFEVKKFSDPPLWVPYLPVPGTYKHAKYGNIHITKERNEEFIRNFRDGVYQEKLPLDAEHQSKLSGAVGWIVDMRMNDDGSVDAMVDWTDRGVALIEANRFKYISPEWFDSWTDPATEKTFKNVAIGGALTTRPFFKEKALRPLVANEEGLLVPVGEEGEDGKTVVYFFEPAKQERKDDMGDKSAATQNNEPKMVTLTEEQHKAFIEMQAAFAEIRAERDSLKETVANQGKIIEDITRQSRRKRFTDEVRGRSDSNGCVWFGDLEKHVQMMEYLADNAGEDSDVFKNYVEEQRRIANAMEQSALFTEQGRDGRGSSDNSGSSQLEQMIQNRAREKSIPYAQAFSEVVSENPHLYEAHRKGVSVRVGSSGHSDGDE